MIPVLRNTPTIRPMIHSMVLLQQVPQGLFDTAFRVRKRSDQLSQWSIFGVYCSDGECHV
jgi:hypothetical protein